MERGLRILELLRRPGARMALEVGGVFGLLVLVYLLSGYGIPRGLGAFTRIYVVYPLLWCVLIAATVLASRYGRFEKLHFSKSLLWISLLVGAFQVACAVIAALLSSFGESPYAHTPYYIFLNTVFFGSTLVGMEFTRAYLLNVSGKNQSVLLLVLITLVFTALSIPLARFTTAGFLSLIFFAGTVLPLLAQNLLASFLALTTRGPVAAIAYIGVLRAFEWYSPILPDLSWQMAAFVGTLAPVVGLLVIQSQLSEPEPRGVAAGKPAKRGHSLASWIIIAIVAVVIIWSSFGLLGFRPVVVISGSMSPEIDVGDVVVVRKVPVEDIQVGDVIQYKQGDTTIIHRVVEIRNQSAPVFITKGDADNSPDPSPVYPSQILGKVSFTVPEVGWVSIWIKGLFN